MANCIVQRVSYTADLGYEIFCDHMSVRHLWDTLTAAGAEFNIRPFGMRAMMSLRLDKWFGSWGREFSPDYTPMETGLDRFIRWNKEADWIGKAAATGRKGRRAEAQTRLLHRGRRRRRCRGVGADLAGRRRRRLVHLWRLLAFHRQIAGAWASCPPTVRLTGSKLKSKSSANVARPSSTCPAVRRRRCKDARIGLPFHPASFHIGPNILGGSGGQTAPRLWPE